eukprot:TRINITY_DN1113_c0_g1_i1.p1 TRINITY_DN1113_c0_g1~~TRINITY_DN1113_c0_g1_i1.p1  ORF type:complete len:634 (-),score=122.56 TRINITY_DN1113_c0_g1_i1:1781-3682(-)
MFPLPKTSFTRKGLIRRTRPLITEPLFDISDRPSTVVGFTQGANGHGKILPENLIPVPPRDAINDITTPIKSLHSRSTTASTWDFGRVLDANMIMESIGTRDPADVEEFEMCDANLSRVLRRHAARFTNLKKMRLNGNQFVLSELTHFPVLTELFLSCNQLSQIVLPDNVFAHLQTLDLSYNRLSQQSLRTVGLLPQLRELDLTCNDLTEFPSFNDPPIFTWLETLIAAQNQLTSIDALQAIGQLPNLLRLDLSKNNIMRLSEQILAFHGYNQLMDLDLSYNLLTKELDVMPVSELPNMQRLVLVGNPMIRRDKGMPLLQARFVEERGMTVVIAQRPLQKPPIVIGRELAEISEKLYDARPEIVLAPNGNDVTVLDEMEDDAGFEQTDDDNGFFITEGPDIVARVFQPQKVGLSSSPSPPPVSHIRFPPKSALHALSVDASLPPALRAKYKIEDRRHVAPTIDGQSPALARDAAINSLRHALQRPDIHHVPPANSKKAIERPTAASKVKTLPPRAAREHERQQRLKQESEQHNMPTDEEIEQSRRVDQVDKMLDGLTKQLSEVEQNLHGVLLANKRLQREKVRQQQRAAAGLPRRTSKDAPAPQDAFMEPLEFQSMVQQWVDSAVKPMGFATM